MDTTLRPEQGEGLADDERARRAAEQPQLVLSALALALIGVDAEERIVLWNAEAEGLFGRAAEQCLGQPLAAASPWPETAAAALAVRECLLTGERRHLPEVRHTGPDGRGALLAVTVSPLPAADNRRHGCVVAAEDVTGRKLLESRAAQSEKLAAVEQLAAGLAHELNTPAQYVGDNVRFALEAWREAAGLLARFRELANRAGAPRPISYQEVLAQLQELLAETEKSDLDYLLGETPAALEQALEGVGRVSRIVGALKGFASPGPAGKPPSDLNSAIRDTVTVSRHQWEPVAEVVTDLASDLPAVPCVVRDISQAVLSLLANATEAIAEVGGDGADGKGTITISTRAVGDWAEIRVSDTGQGIPEGIRSRVFEPFFTTREVGKGTGLGLAMVHCCIAEKHEGTIDLVSEVGKGTTFTIRLPL